MLRSDELNLFSRIYIVIFIVSSSIFSHGKMLDDGFLNVGEELKEETLPLRMGSRVYQLQGLKSLTCTKEVHFCSGGLYLLVAVEPEVCDELLMMVIPYKAWGLVVFALLCLGLALIIPGYLPSYLLVNQNVAKQS
ncbi:hypothetical protein PTKIN_Ptkin03bG0204100 [Pterospermum kingtungense]